ncbi:glycosyltransferase [Brachybacterium sp. GPGPB12]|uniref:glycosyltransferase n=1 Tax=Brachybacterium sp. GPGPB12 TaxID=3023517 RepID=UPI00313437BE
MIARMREVRPHRVVVIKGDGLDERFWDALGDTPRILWLYDDLHRHDYTDEFLRQVGPVVDYARSETDMLRARGVDAHFVPNAFDPHRSEPTSRRTDEIVFIGSGYANRKEPLTHLAEHDLPVHAWGRDFSRHPFDRARTFSWSRPPIAASREVPLERAYQIHAEGAAAVAIHGLQNGHAMRTFEIPGMGGVRLVDRDDVDQFYEVGTEVAVWHDREELLDLARRALQDRAWGRGCEKPAGAAPSPSTPSIIASRRSIRCGRTDPPQLPGALAGMAEHTEPRPPGEARRHQCGALASRHASRCPA